MPPAPSYGACACALLAVAMGQGVWPQRGEPNPTVLKYKLRLQTVPTVHLASYTQSNIVHRQNPGSLPEYREDRCCLVTGGTLAH